MQDVGIFSQVSAEELAYLAAIVKEEEHEVGEVIYNDKDQAGSMYLVVEGRVRVHRDELEITVAGEGDTIGIWALFDDEPRVGTATVVEAARVLRIDKEDFIDLLAEVRKIKPDVTRIILTGYADKENAIKAINEVGLFQYVEKPWDNDQLLIIIRNGLDKHFLLRNLREKITEINKAYADLQGIQQDILKTFA